MIDALVNVWFTTEARKARKKSDLKILCTPCFRGEIDRFMSIGAERKRNPAPAER
jgi:hypothetical protein